MANQLPPDYDYADSEQVPAYSNNSNISARWHIINTPAKGLYGTRGISFVSDPSATTNPTAATQSTVGLGYDLLFVDSVQMEVHPLAPTKERSSSSAGKPWKTPVVAKIQFGSESQTQASVIFSSENKSKIAVDARDLMPDLLQSNPTATDTPTYIPMYYVNGKADIIPLCWSAETNKEYTEFHVSDNKGSLEDTGSNPIKTETKRSWKSKLKESVGPKPLSAEEQRIKDGRMKQEKERLTSNFTLQDSRGNVHARFSNEIFKESSTFTKIPTYDKMAKAQKSWGHLDLNESCFTFLRSSYSAFEKWSDADLELVVLLSLMAVLEITIKINGGSGPTAPFSSYYSAINGGDPRREGLPALVGAGLHAISNTNWMAMSN